MLPCAPSEQKTVFGYHITVGADNPNDAVNKLYNPSGVEVFYSMRHVEEAWHHLMKSEDTAKFKQIAVCNFDFLLASVSVASCIRPYTVYLAKLGCKTARARERELDRKAILRKM